MASGNLKLFEEVSLNASSGFLENQIGSKFSTRPPYICYREIKTNFPVVKPLKSPWYVTRKTVFCQVPTYCIDCIDDCTVTSIWTGGWLSVYCCKNPHFFKGNFVRVCYSQRAFQSKHDKLYTTRKLRFCSSWTYQKLFLNIQQSRDGWLLKIEP